MANESGERRSWREWIDQNPWPAAVCFGLTLAGVLGFVVWAPPRAWELIARTFEVLPWEGIVAVVLGTLGLTGAHFMGSIVPKRRDASGRTMPPASLSNPPTVRDDRKRDGFAQVETLIYVALFGAFTLAALLRLVAGLLVLVVVGIGAASLSGCQLSAIGVATRGVHSAIQVVPVVQDFADGHHASAVEACTDAACVEAADAEWIPVLEAADTAIPILGAALASLEVAEAAGRDALDEAGALALAAAIDLWARIVALCADHGLTISNPWGSR